MKEVNSMHVDVEEYIMYLKAERRKTYDFIMENVNKVAPETTFEEFTNIVKLMQQIFSAQPNELECFFYLFWQHVSEFWG